MKEIKTVTEEMTKIIKKFSDFSQWPEAEFCLYEDTRWHEMPVAEIYEFGLKDIQLWVYDDKGYICYFAGTETEVVEKLDSAINEIIQKEKEREERYEKERLERIEKEKEDKIKIFEELKKELGK